MRAALFTRLGVSAVSQKEKMKSSEGETQLCDTLCPAEDYTAEDASAVEENALQPSSSAPTAIEEEEEADDYDDEHEDAEEEEEEEDPTTIVPAAELVTSTWDADDATLATLARQVRETVLEEEDDTLASTAHDFWVRSCVYARKGDITRASKLLRGLVQWKTKIGGDKLQRVPDLLHRGAVWSSGARDRHGRHILHVRIRDADPGLFTPEDVVRALALAAEWTLRTYPAARTHGVVVLVDAAGTGLTGVDTRLPGAMMHAFSRTMPLRVAAFCVLNPPWFLRPVLALATALMGAKLRSRVRVFGRPEELAPYFDVDVVPVDAEMGGTLYWDLDVQEKWACEVLEAAKTWPPVVELEDAEELDEMEEAEDSDEAGDVDGTDEAQDVEEKVEKEQEEEVKEVKLEVKQEEEEEEEAVEEAKEMKVVEVEEVKGMKKVEEEEEKEE